jgi:hypothetical protein
MPGMARYSRMPTRYKVQLFWTFAFGSALTYQFLQLTVWRVNEKREEQQYLKLKEQYGDKLPPDMLEQTVALRELRDTLTMHQAMNSPTPGEVAGALQRDLDASRLGAIRRL